LSVLDCIHDFFRLIAQIALRDLRLGSHKGSISQCSTMCYCVPSRSEAAQRVRSSALTSVERPSEARARNGGGRVGQPKALPARSAAGGADVRSDQRDDAA
jgi:hypothetical protein